MQAKLGTLAFIAVLALSMSGCTAAVQGYSKDMAVTMQGGIPRKVTLYALDGHPIKVWQGRITIEGHEGQSLMFMVDGKRQFLSGHYSIEEE